MSTQVSMLQRLVLQFARFGTVGVLNTLVDFATTNALMFLLAPSSRLGLFAVSAAACAVAACNSYYLNSRWTFRARNETRMLIPRFMAVSSLGLMINSATFASATAFLQQAFPSAPTILLVNAGKLAGVCMALSVTFLGYRFAVFASDRMTRLRRRNLVQGAIQPTTPQERRHLLLLLVIAILVRLLFAWATQVHASPAGGMLFHGWLAMLQATGIHPSRTPLAASLIPGVLVLVPLFFLTRQLYGSHAAFLASWFCALHPRLLEYSVNGNAGILALFCLVCAAWAGAETMRKANVRGFALSFALLIVTFLTLPAHGTSMEPWGLRVRSLGESLPLMLLSPIFVFAMLLPLLGRRKRRHRHHGWPIGMLAGSPLILALQDDGTALLPFVVATHILAAAGIVAMRRTIVLATGQHIRLLDMNIVHWLSGGLMLLLVLADGLVAWSLASP